MNCFACIACNMIKRVSLSIPGSHAHTFSTLCTHIRNSAVFYVHSPRSSLINFSYAVPRLSLACSQLWERDGTTRGERSRALPSDAPESSHCVSVLGGWLLAIEPESQRAEQTNATITTTTTMATSSNRRLIPTTRRWFRSCFACSRPSSPLICETASTSFVRTRSKKYD
jgi:hypothetical protein